MTKTREKLEKIIADAQAQLKAMDEKLVIFDGWVPQIGDEYFLPRLFDSDTLYYAFSHSDDEIDRLAIKRCSAFQTRKQAAAVADAICVMLELRNQPGAFSSDSEGDGYIFNYRTDKIMFCVMTWSIWQGNMLCPCFATAEKCEQAVDAVGRERVERALKLWAGVAL